LQQRLLSPLKSAQAFVKNWVLGSVIDGGPQRVSAGNGGQSTSCQPSFHSVSAVEAERAFVRDEAEEKNNEANESPTGRHSFRSTLSINSGCQNLLESRLVLFCVTSTGLKGWTGPDLVHKQCSFCLSSVCMAVCGFSRCVSYHMIDSDCLNFVSVLKHASPVCRSHVRHETRGAQCSQSRVGG